MSYYDVPEIALEHRRGILPLAGAVIIFSIAVSAWASLLGQSLIIKFVTLTAGGVVAALIFLEPFVGLCIMILLIPVEQIYAFAGGWLSGVKAVGIVTFAGALANAQIRRRVLHFDKQSRWIFAFAFWIGLSFLWSHQKEATPLLMVLTTAQLALFWVLLRASLATQDELRAVSVCFIVGTLLAIVASAVAPRWGLAPRLIYSTGNPNHLARDIVVSLVLLMYFAPGARSWAKLVAIGAGGFLVLGLVLTQSRGGWIGALLCIPLVLIGHRRILPLAAVGGMGFLAVILFTMQVLSAHLGVTESVLETRWDSMFHKNVIRISRLDTWRAGVTLGVRNPILGVGAGGFVQAIAGVLETMPDYIGPSDVGAHNTYVSVFAELGLIGLILLGGILWHCGRFIARQPRSLEKMLAWALLLSALVRTMFGDVHFQKTIWLTLALSQVVLTMEGGSRERSEGTPALDDGGDQ